MCGSNKWKKFPRIQNKKTEKYKINGEKKSWETGLEVVEKRGNTMKELIKYNFIIISLNLTKTQIDSSWWEFPNRPR